MFKQKFCPAVAVLATAGIVLGTGSTTASGDDTDSVFGSASRSEAALVGVLYDLKQTQNHQPTGVSVDDYSRVVGEYIKKQWDESVLDRFYRVSRPIYTTQIFVPNMDAGLAPKAFNVDKYVQPSEWVIHYKAQVSPPGPGTYRFWGCADDAFAVAVNGKTVLVGNRPDMEATAQSGWHSSEPPGAQAADDPLIAGDWVTLDAGEIIDLDVLIGERPGGFFNAFMMVEKQGESYQKDGQGHSVFPIFQVAPYDTPAVNDLNREPQFAKGFPAWKSWQ